MKNYFDWLLEDSLKLTEPFISWEKEARPEEYSSKIINPNRKPIHVISKGWIEEERKASMRYARFQSEVIDIGTIMIYPTSSPNLLPVFAAEWVAVMDNIHVIVLDVHNLTDYKPIREFENCHKKWKTIFPNNKEMPAWFESIASPQHIFSKSTIESVQSLKEMYREYLSITMSSIYSENIKIAKGGSDHALVKDYKIHHALYSPARTIVKEENKEWLNVFLNKYHFGII